MVRRLVTFIVRVVATTTVVAGLWVVSPWFFAPTSSIGEWALLGSSYWARVVVGVLLLFFAYVLFSSTSGKRTVRYGRWYWRDWDIRGRD